MGENRCLVFIQKIRTLDWYDYSIYQAINPVATKVLKHFNPNLCDGLQIIEKPDGVITSSGSGKMQSEFSPSAWENFSSLAKSNNGKPLIGTIVKICGDDENAYTLRELAQKIALIEAPSRCVSNPTTASDDVVKAPFYTALYKETAVTENKYSGFFFMPPLSNAASAPLKSLDNERLAYQERVLTPGSWPIDPIAIGQFREYSKELISLLQSTASAYGPHGVIRSVTMPDEIVDQAVSSKKREYVAAYEEGLDDNVKCVAKIKKEAYPIESVGFKAPRFYFPVDKRVVVQMLAYTDALCQFYGQHFHWYAFKLDPKEIGHTIHKTLNISINIGGETYKIVAVAETDYSKFDGSIKRDLHDIVLDIESSLFESWLAALDRDWETATIL
jgi:hypothetical protein